MQLCILVNVSGCRSFHTFASLVFKLNFKFTSCPQQDILPLHHIVPALTTKIRSFKVIFHNLLVTMVSIAKFVRTIWSKNLILVLRYFHCTESIFVL